MKIEPKLYKIGETCSLEDDCGFNCQASGQNVVCFGEHKYEMARDFETYNYVIYTYKPLLYLSEEQLEDYL